MEVAEGNGKNSSGGITPLQFLLGLGGIKLIIGVVAAQTGAALGIDEHFRFTRVRRQQRSHVFNTQR